MSIKINRKDPKNKREKKPQGIRVSDSSAKQPFYMLGFNMTDDRHQQFYFYATSCKSIIKLTPSKMNKQNLLMLAPLNWWISMCPNADGTSFSHVVATDFLVTHGTEKGYFVEENVRGRGMWMDDDRIVLHSGTHLLVDGLLNDLNIESEYVYELRTKLRIADKALPVTDCRKVTKVLQQLNWETLADGRLLAGWLMVAPLSGVLKWRPHIWVTGSKNSGKSWVLSNLCVKLLNGFSKHVQGNTSEAGMRQSMNGDIMPFIVDELDSNTEKGNIRIQEMMEYARAASEGVAEILKGTKGGQAVAYRPRSCFLAGSIIPHLKDDNDKRRFCVLNISKMKRDEDFRASEKELNSFLTKDFARAFQARSVFYAKEILKSIEVFTDAVTSITGSRAKGDQIGTLLGGWWHTMNDKVVTLAVAMTETKAILELLGEDKTTEDVPDELACLQMILGAETRVEGSEFIGTLTVGELVKMCAKHEDYKGLMWQEAESRLKRLGLKVSDYKGTEYLWVYNRSEFVKNLLKNSMFGLSHSSALGRIEGALKSIQGKYSDGIEGRGVLVPIDSIFL